MNGHGGKRKGAGARKQLSDMQQAYAAALCEELQRRSAKRVTARRLEAHLNKSFANLYLNYREIQRVHPMDRHLVDGIDDMGIINVELAQEAKMTNKAMLQGNRLHSMPLARGFKRSWITKVIARIMSHRSGRIIKPEYIRKIWNRWGPVVRSH